jgi:hypothetical protein
MTTNHELPQSLARSERREVKTGRGSQIELHACIAAEFVVLPWNRQLEKKSRTFFTREDKTYDRPVVRIATTGAGQS